MPAVKELKLDPSMLDALRYRSLQIKNGDFVLVDYTLKVKESGDIVDTTVEAVAEEKGIRHEHGEGAEPHRYEPLFLVVGEGMIPKGFDEGLVGLEPGQSSTIQVPPENGYGLRDASKVRLVPLKRFRNEGITPVPGVQINLDGKIGVVRSVGAGRVQMDYNHPLAGRTLLYDVTIQRIVEESEDKIRSLIHKRLPVADPNRFKVGMEENKLKIEVPEEAFFLEDLQLSKKAVTADIEKYFPEISEICFLEVFKKVAPAKIEETGRPEETEKSETLKPEA